MECFITDCFFYCFYPKTSKFGFSLAGGVLVIESEHFRGFFELLDFRRPLISFFLVWGILPAQQQKCLILIFGPCHLTPFEATCAFTFW